MSNTTKKVDTTSISELQREIQEAQKEIQAVNTSLYATLQVSTTRTDKTDFSVPSSERTSKVETDSELMNELRSLLATQ